MKRFSQPCPLGKWPLKSACPTGKLLAPDCRTWLLLSPELNPIELSEEAYNNTNTDGSWWWNTVNLRRVEGLQKEPQPVHRASWSLPFALMSHLSWWNVPGAWQTVCRWLSWNLPCNRCTPVGWLLSADGGSTLRMSGQSLECAQSRETAGVSRGMDSSTARTPGWSSVKVWWALLDFLLREYYDFLEIIVQVLLLEAWG